jgi:hypothetical protein
MTTSRGAMGALVLLLPLTLAACAPGTPDADSWHQDAERATGDAASAVSTMALVIEERERIPANYLQVAAVDSEEAADTAAQSLSTVQPPDSLRDRHEEVTAALDEAAGLVAEARIAVVRHDTASYDALRTELGDVADQLSGLESDLRKAAER